MARILGIAVLLDALLMRLRLVQSCRSSRPAAWWLHRPARTCACGH